MNIDDLLNKYFEGETTCEDEKRLRSFFASDKVSERLAIYKPMFAYFDEEISKRQQQKEKKKRLFTKQKLLYSLSAIAATFLLLIGIRQFILPPDPCLCSGNYVVINGRCYTDLDKVKELAFDALQEVATPTGEYFPEELRSIFNDDE